MKYRISAAALLLALLLSACGGEKFSLPIEVPPGSQGFAYSYEEVSSPSGRIELACGEGLGDTRVALLPVDDTRPPEPAYITPGMPAVIEVEKGKWYKVGVDLPNSGGEPLRVYVEASRVEVRIE